MNGLVTRLVYGMIGSRADITIQGGNPLHKMATIVKLRKKDLKPPDKVPKNYDQWPFTQHGRMDLDITFAGKMTMSVYIKMDAGSNCCSQKECATSFASFSTILRFNCLG